MDEKKSHSFRKRSCSVVKVLVLMFFLAGCTSPVGVLYPTQAPVKVRAKATAQIQNLVPPTLAEAMASPVPVTGPSPEALVGLQKIQHFIFIIQENRSFDSYFGTYPGADGIPKGVCLPDPLGRPLIPRMMR